MVGEGHSGDCAAVQVCQRDIDNLKDWQRSQNGHLGTMAADLNKLRTELVERQDRLQMWMLATLATGIFSLLAVVASVFVMVGNHLLSGPKP